mmetsp:Transcript_37384/g.81447  ORF Transcript_37384/g.81447 Transcript_37384/m.81447 type:complete len:210 (+) Transcript_37384:1229-1858(+)
MSSLDLTLARYTLLNHSNPVALILSSPFCTLRSPSVLPAVIPSAKSAWGGGSNGTKCRGTSGSMPPMPIMVAAQLVEHRCRAMDGISMSIRHCERALRHYLGRSYQSGYWPSGRHASPLPEEKGVELMTRATKLLIPPRRMGGRSWGTRLPSEGRLYWMPMINGCSLLLDCGAVHREMNHSDSMGRDWIYRYVCYVWRRMRPVIADFHG